MEISNEILELIGKRRKIVSYHHLTFGVEIEFLEHISWQWMMNNIPSTLIKNGFSVKCEWDMPEINNKKDWILKEDSSCGLELVSPILSGKDIELIPKICNILNYELGLDVDIDCGLHVHIGAEYFPLWKLKRIVQKYQENEMLINHLVGYDRHENDQCRPIEDVIDLPNFYAAEDNEYLIASVAHRKCKVNMLALEKHGTIEFRQHHGSLDADEVTNWIKFIQDFVCIALTGDIETECNTEDELFINPELYEYYFQKRYPIKYNRFQSENFEIFQPEHYEMIMQGLISA